ncbi:hypothetical protein [Streptomyces torulosus]|uniref:hypothetical protein n=1 Tax=Streptomyces torulosus TaxID=68276 RepID=UPI0006EBC231|nr:hypothetical protein [Streptomyces torulosus]
MATSDMSLTPHPAGYDDDLRLALEDLLLDRWLSTKTLLANTRSWALRTSRSQVLAAGAAKGDAIAAWCAEEPTDANALMMRARVMTHRVLVAHRSKADRHTLLPRVSAARAACEDAARRWPADPVPWVCLLALAQLDVDPRRWHAVDHWANPPEAMLPRGPWPLLWQVDRRDWPNREAYHRMLQCLQARGTGAVDFTRWVSSQAKPGSVQLPLPLYAWVEEYRSRMASRQVASTLGFWDNEQVRHYVERARDGWFAHVTEMSTCSLLDLNYLAYTLTACGLPGAAEVFTAIGPFATPAPWQHVSESRWWQDDFLQARNYAMKRERSRR